MLACIFHKLRREGEQIAVNMYSAVLVVTLALALNHGSPFRWSVWAALLIDLVVELMAEEQLLEKKYWDKTLSDMRKRFPDNGNRI